MNTFTKISKSFILAALMVFGVVTAQAQDEEGGLSFAGSVDTYFRQNLNASNDPTAGGTIAPGTSFANQPGFALGMVNLITSYDGEKTGFVADLVFGPRGTDAVFASTTASSSIVNQLYAYWTVSESLTLTIGNFNTFLGYEVISPTANFNYSTSYMFSYGPFSHSGLKADIALGEASLMLGVLNPTDFTDFNPDGTYLAGIQLGVAGQYFNALIGDGYTQLDFTGGFDLSDATYLGINATWNKDLFNGAALYLQQSLSDDFSLGIRGEWFSDEGVGALPFVDADGDGVPDAGFVAPGSVINLTASANYSVGNLTFIPEFRVDIHDEDAIVPEAGETPTGALASFVLAAVYSF